MNDYFRTGGEMPNLVPDHVVIESEVSIDLGKGMMADGTPIDVTRTTVDKMMPKQMLSPGISYAEKNEHVHGMRRLPHAARANLLNVADRRVYDLLTQDRKTGRMQAKEVARLQTLLMDRAGIPEHYAIEERPQPMEIYGVWFDPLTGQRVENPNVTYRQNKLVNNQFDLQYNANLRDILANGEERTDRTGVRTLSKFGSIKHTIDLREGFPATTGKKFAFNTNKGETMDWMLKGKFDLKSLKELGIRIWDQNVIPGSEVFEELCVEDRVKLLTPGQKEQFDIFREELRAIKPYLSSTEYEDAFHAKMNNWGVQEKKLIDGDLGKIYGKQWRAWEDTRIIPYSEWVFEKFAYEKRGFELLHFVTSTVGTKTDTTHAVIGRGIDQVAQVEKAIAERSDSRRIILTGWNVAQLDEMSLPPCHTMAQWYVSQQKDEDGKNFLDVELYQRSNDMFLGACFNVAQYALITELLAHVHGLRARMLYHTIGDAHIYLNHIEGPNSVTELLKRPIIHNSPKLVIAQGDYKSILDVPSSAVTMEGYESYPAFKNVPIAK